MSDCPVNKSDLQEIIATYNAEINTFKALYNANLTIGFVTGFISIIVSSYVLIKTYQSHNYKPIIFVVTLLGLHSLDIFITVILMSL
jgi:hypothetical protein